MLGTGLSASSLSESKTPSTTSSSSTEGTYWRQIGSLGDLIRSTIAGEIRNSKFSAAIRRRSRSGKCSGPNFAARVSSELIEFFLRTSCQVSMMLPALLRVMPRNERLHVHDLVISRSVELRDGGDSAISSCFIEGARAGVFRPAGGLHDDQAGEAGEAPLHLRHEPAADAAAMARGIDGKPVHVPGADGAGRGPPADPAGDAPRFLRDERGVRRVAAGGRVEHLEGHEHLVGAEEAAGARDRLDGRAVGGGGGTERDGGARRHGSGGGRGGGAHAGIVPGARVRGGGAARASAASVVRDRPSASSTICRTSSS